LLFVRIVLRNALTVLQISILIWEMYQSDWEKLNVFQESVWFNHKGTLSPGYKLEFILSRETLQTGRSSVWFENVGNHLLLWLDLLTKMYVVHIQSNMSHRWHKLLFFKLPFIKINYVWCIPPQINNLCFCFVHTLIPKITTPNN
jgi:hypothetical protein